MNKSTDIGLADDETTCAFCGLKIAVHTRKTAAVCRAGLNAREVAAEKAVIEEVVFGKDKKSIGERIDALDVEISKLEDRRKELLFEEAKEEARQDEDFLEEVHKDCVTKERHEEALQDAEDAAEDRARAEEAWDYLAEFGGHAPACLSGALVGENAPHPLCTCGWNHVATRLEQA